MIVSKVANMESLHTILRGHMKILLKMKQKITDLPLVLKYHSGSIISNASKNCECLAAYKIRRGQQMFSFYKRLWGEVRFKNIINQLRQGIFKQLISKCHAFMVTGFCLSNFDWESNRISDKKILENYDDLKFVKTLAEKTLVCKVCHKRLVIDTFVNGIEYCTCEGSKPVYNKKYDKCPWMPFLERQNLLVWRKESGQDSGLYEYKVHGIYEDVRADIFLKVQVDLKCRKNWDPTAVQIQVLETENKSNSDIIYWELLWPTFFSNRDYVFNRRFSVDPVHKVIIIYNQVTKVDSVPIYPDKVRVKDYWCVMVIKPFKTFDEPGIEFSMTYFDNPGLTIPSSVQAWVATSAMPDFLSRLRKYAVKYMKDYLQSPDTISPWPDNFTMSNGKSPVNKKSTDDDNGDSAFKFYVDAFCSKSS